MCNCQKMFLSLGSIKFINLQNYTYKCAVRLLVKMRTNIAPLIFPDDGGWLMLFWGADALWKARNCVLKDKLSVFDELYSVACATPQNSAVSCFKIQITFASTLIIKQLNLSRVQMLIY